MNVLKRTLSRLWRNGMTKLKPSLNSASLHRFPIIPGATVAVKVQGPNLDKPGKYCVDKDKEGKLRWLIKKDPFLFDGTPSGLGDVPL
jgi:hypothetical protein